MWRLSILNQVSRCCIAALLCRRLVVLCFALGMMLFIIEQYIEPIVENSIGPLRTMVSLETHRAALNGHCVGWYSQ